MKILLASDHYPPFIGGAHRQTQLLGKELQCRGHQVNVATVWHPSVPEEENDGGVKVYRLRQLRTWFEQSTNEKAQRHQPPFADPVTIRGLKRIIEEFQPDIVHSYGWITYSVATALAGESIPLLISARDYAYGCATRTLVQRGEKPCSGPSLFKCIDCASHLYGVSKGVVAAMGVTSSRAYLKNRVNGIHSISTYVQEMIDRDFLQSSDANIKIDDSPVVQAIIPSFRESAAASDYESDLAIKKYMDTLPNENYILFVGALRKVKGVYQLLAAYEKLVNPPALVLIGTFEADTPKLFPPGVHVLPNFPHRAVMAAWERSLFGVIPSLWPEPLGSVVYEGMSAGKAMIGTKPGGHTDMIVDGETGILVAQGDVEALRAAMQKLIDNPALCQRYGHAGWVRAQQFTADVNVPRFEEMYRRLVKSSVDSVKQESHLEAV